MLFFNKKNHETRMLYLKENYFTRKENVVVLIQENILIETTMPDLKHESSYPFLICFNRTILTNKSYEESCYS